MNPTPIVFTPAECEALARLVESGLLFRQIVQRMGYSATVVRREMRRLGITRQPLARPWTKAEEAILKELSGKVTQREIAAHLGRSYQAVHVHIGKIGAGNRGRAGKRRTYTDAERAIILANYGKAPVKDWIHLLPGRTSAAIASFAIRGLKMKARRPVGPIAFAYPVRPAAHQAIPPA